MHSERFLYSKPFDLSLKLANPLGSTMLSDELSSSDDRILIICVTHLRRRWASHFLFLYTSLGFQRYSVTLHLIHASCTPPCHGVEDSPKYIFNSMRIETISYVVVLTAPNSRFSSCRTRREVCVLRADKWPSIRLYPILVLAFDFTPILIV